MKNTIKFFGIIALTAVMTLAFAACNNGSNNHDESPPSTNGKLTVTGLASYNGKYVFAHTTPYISGMYLCADNIDLRDMVINCGVVSGGQVVLKVWKGTDDYKLAPFSGNATIPLDIKVFDVAAVAITDPETMTSIPAASASSTKTVTFVSGSANVGF